MLYILKVRSADERSKKLLTSKNEIAILKILSPNLSNPGRRSNKREGGRKEKKVLDKFSKFC